MYRAMLTLGCFAASQAFGHTPVIVELFETDDWCAVIAAGYGGDTYLFHPGDYYGPCEVVGPEPDMGGERLMMESYDPQNPAVFHHDGSAEYILTLSGTAVSLRYVALGSLPAGVDGVRRGGVDMHIRGLAGEQLAGRAIVTVADLRGLEVIESELTHVSGTGIEVGCADCRVVNVLLEDNLIVGATRGVEVTHGVWGTARDNFIGGGVHGIRWVGTPTESLLEENFVGGKL